MATEAQIEANRRNAQHSTGPRTEAGKANSSRNATKFGLFSTNNCVLPGEEEFYDHFCHTIWDSLVPVGSIEELTAGNLRGNEIAAAFVAALPRIFRILRSRPGPFVARVSQAGHVAIT